MLIFWIFGGSHNIYMTRYDHNYKVYRMWCVFTRCSRSMLPIMPLKNNLKEETKFPTLVPLRILPRESTAFQHPHSVVAANQGEEGALPANQHSAGSSSGACFKGPVGTNERLEVEPEHRGRSKKQGECPIGSKKKPRPTSQKDEPVS